MVDDADSIGVNVAVGVEVNVVVSVVVNVAMSIVVNVAVSVVVNVAVSAAVSSSWNCPPVITESRAALLFSSNQSRFRTACRCRRGRCSSSQQRQRRHRRSAYFSRVQWHSSRTPLLGYGSL